MSCPSATAPIAAVDRFCEACGARLEGADHRETDLGPVAALTDRGLLRACNEDAYAVSAGQTGLAAVVCDGVSTTGTLRTPPTPPPVPPSRPSTAGMGAEGGLDRLASRAVLAAGESVRGEDGSTTIVLGLVRPGEVVVANVGDSRAYWLGDDGEHILLSIDDAGPAS